MAVRNLIKGIGYRIKKNLKRPYAVFDIGWLEEKRLKHDTDGRLKSHLYQQRYKIVFKDAREFLVSVEELFINEFYKFRSDTDRPVIIDCGSYIGTSILYFKVNYPGAVVTGFEPDSSNYSLLKQNLENWHLPGTEVHNAAIWTNNDGIAFNAAGNMGSRIDTETGAAGTLNKVQTVRLKDLLTREIDFLKIDIEGAELPVLKDCGDQLKRVKNLFVEYHGSYAKQSELNEILDILLENGFRYYIKEGSPIHLKPFWDKGIKVEYDLLLNIFAFRG